MRAIILNIIDFFYFPFFRKWIPLRTFRYLACGGFTTVLDIFLFYISYQFILNKQMVHLPFITISAYIAAFILAFFISFPTGFSLSKYVVFPESELKGRVQLFRYLLQVACCVLLNYLFLKFFVEICHFYPTVSKCFTAVFVAFFSYISQKHFTFRIKDGNLKAGQLKEHLNNGEE